MFHRIAAACAAILILGCDAAEISKTCSAEIVGAIRIVHAGGTYLSPSVAQALFRAPQARPVLSDREQQILSFLGQGHHSKVIASALDLSVRTVESHRQSIRRKLNLAGQAELIKYAVEHAGRGG